MTILDTSGEVDSNVISMYQSMIGALQWTISLGRFDIATAVMTMSSFHVAPHEGHLDRVKHIYGYLAKYPDGVIHVRTDEPSSLQDIKYDWEYCVYGRVSEMIPDNIPPPLGEEVVTTTYVDENLFHDLITGHAATGILHLVNGNPVDWYPNAKLLLRLQHMVLSLLLLELQPIRSLTCVPHCITWVFL